MAGENPINPIDVDAAEAICRAAAEAAESKTDWKFSSAASKAVKVLPAALAEIRRLRALVDAYSEGLDEIAAGASVGSVWRKLAEHIQANLKVSPVERGEPAT